MLQGLTIEYGHSFIIHCLSDDPDATQHEIYIAVNSKQFFGGEPYFNALDNHCLSTSTNVMMVTGMSGCGKTW